MMNIISYSWKMQNTYIVRNFCTRSQIFFFHDYFFLLADFTRTLAGDPIFGPGTICFKIWTDLLVIYMVILGLWLGFMLSLGLGLGRVLVEGWNQEFCQCWNIKQFFAMACVTELSQDAMKASGKLWHGWSNHSVRVITLLILTLN